MTRKLIAGGLVVAALVAGLAGVSAYVISSDHTAHVPLERPAAAAKSQPADSDAALDLSDWTETRNVIPNGGSGRRRR